ASRDFSLLALALAPALVSLAKTYHLDDPEEAFEALLRAARAGAPSLYTVVSHALHDPRRKEWKYADARARYQAERRHLSHPAPAREEGPGDLLGPFVEGEVISEREAHVLVGAEVLGYPAAELAKLLGISPNAVQLTRSRGRAKLRRTLTKKFQK